MAPFPLTIGAYVVEKFKQVEVKAKELEGSHFVTLNYRTYDPEKVVAAYCKKAKFSWSYTHTRKNLEDGIRNWYNSTREINPIEQQAIEDELLYDFQDDVSLRERTPKGAKESRKQKGKEVEDPLSDNEEEVTLIQRNAKFARKK